MFEGKNKDTPEGDPYVFGDLNNEPSSNEMHVLLNQQNAGVANLSDYCFSKISNIFLSDLSESISSGVGVGLTLNKSTSPPSLHMLDLPFYEIVKSIPRIKEDLAEGLKKYEHLCAKTPSIEAFKALLLILKKVTENKKTKSEISKLLKEVKNLDLVSSKQSDLKKRIDVEYDNLSFTIDISLGKVSTFTKLTSYMVSTDLSRQSKLNKLQFELDFKIKENKKNGIIRFFAGETDQFKAYAFATVITGISALGARIGLYSLELTTQKLIPANHINQLLENYGDVGAIAIGLVASFNFLEHFRKKNALKNKINVKMN